MLCRIKQDPNGKWSTDYTIEKFLVRDFGIWCPFIVEHQVEYDYLYAITLAHGKDASQILLDGVHENKTGYPPTFITFPELIA